MEINKSDIEEMEYRLIEAIKSSDIDFLENVMHSDLVAMAPNGQRITKEMDLASHKSGSMVVESLIPSIDEIQIIGDNAIALVTYNTKGKMLGTPIEGTFRYNRVWKRFDNGLKIIAVSCLQV